MDECKPLDMGVKFCAASVPAMLDVLEGGLEGRTSSASDLRTFERNPHLHPAAQKLQKKLHSEAWPSMSTDCLLIGRQFTTAAAAALRVSSAQGLTCVLQLCVGSGIEGMVLSPVRPVHQNIPPTDSSTVRPGLGPCVTGPLMSRT